MRDRDDYDNSTAEQAFGGDAPTSGAQAFGRESESFAPPVPPDAPPARHEQPSQSGSFEPPVAPQMPVTASGQAPAGAPDAQRKLPTPGKATAALVLGVVSWLICPIVLSVMAMIFARQAQSQIDANPTTLGGRGTAQAAFWIGAGSLIVWGLVILVSVIVSFTEGSG